MIQIQTTTVYGLFCRLGKAVRFRNVDGVVQVEKTKILDMWDGTVSDHIKHLMYLSEELEDACITHTEASLDYDDSLIPESTIVTGWTEDMTEDEAKAAVTLSWDN